MKTRPQCWIALTLAVALAAPAAAQISLHQLGSYRTGVFAEGASEITAFDAGSRRLFITNGATGSIDVVSIANPSAPALLFTIDLSAHGVRANSVSTHGGVLVAAVENADKQMPGRAVFFAAACTFPCAALSAVTVGALPDMITFTPDGRRVLVANEGEPNDAYTVDPEGSVSIIDVSAGAALVTQTDVETASFVPFNGAALPGIRIYGPGATVAQDLEPEYIAVAADSKTAWVTLQENNAIAIVDVDAGVVTSLVALGTKDHRRPYNALDPSDRDGGIHIERWPVEGMYMPDAIAAFDFHGRTFLVTANEGDSRDYGGFSEEARVGGVSLDPQRFPDAAVLQQNANLGRLKISTVGGDTDGDGDYDVLYAYGARSLSVWTDAVRQVADSRDDFERLTAALFPTEFNSTNDANGSFDSRSDDKGPEPEGVDVAVIDGRTYAFVGFERIGGVAVYDVTNPYNPRFVDYVNARDFAGDPEADTAGDLGPEGLLFIPAADSPTSDPLLVVSNEVSGSTTVYRVAH